LICHWLQATISRAARSSAASEAGSAESATSSGQAAPDVGGQLLERPPLARGYRPFQVTVDDSGELGRAGAKLGEEAVVITHRRPSRGGLPLA
jgi:hypothetical protein